MRLTAADWVVVAVYGIVTTVLGFWFTRRASRSVEDYFVAGRGGGGGPGGRGRVRRVADGLDPARLDLRDRAHGGGGAGMAAPVVLVAVALATRPDDADHLDRFYRKVRPGG